MKMDWKDWWFLFVWIVLVGTVILLAVEKDENQKLERKISQLQQVVFKCMSKGGGGFTLLFGDEEIESAVCFPVETTKIKEKK